MCFFRKPILTEKTMNYQTCLGKKILKPEDAPFCPIQDFLNPSDAICHKHSVICINKERIVKISLSEV